MMGSSRQILLKLVRMAMGWESVYSLPEEIDWSEVMDLSHEQGVAAIVLDGYEVYLKKNPQEKTFLALPENKPLKARVLGRLNGIENSYQNHLSALSSLSDCLSVKGIPFLVLKGFSCSRYYPIPEHRGCGDIDIYPGQRFSESNKALHNKGVNVDPHYYRHSVSKINNVTIENHRVLCDLRGPRKQTRDFENQLEFLANKSIETGERMIVNSMAIPGAVIPSAMFNSLFLPWHVSAHFEFERVTVRHLLDWALFLIHEGKSIDVDLLMNAKKQYTYGVSKFIDILTNLSLRYLNIPTEGIPIEIITDAVNFDDNLADKVLNYMFVGKPRERDENVWKFRLNNMRRIWQERWKYQDLYGMNVFSFMYYKMKGVLFGVGES